MFDITSFIMGIITGGVGTLILFSFAVTPPNIDKVSNEEIEKELLETDTKKD